MRTEHTVVTSRTWAVVWLSILTALLVAVDALLGGKMFVGVVAGVLLALAGFQVVNARRVFLRVAPDSARRWMTPLAIALFASGVLFVVFAIFRGTRLT